MTEQAVPTDMGVSVHIEEDAAKSRTGRVTPRRKGYGERVNGGVSPIT